jgi:hypothetical protein
MEFTNMRRFDIKRGGKAVRSPWNHSHTTNAIIIRGNPTRRPITVLELHVLICPPNCSGKMYEIMVYIRRIVPMGSICRSFSFNVALVVEALSGVWKKKIMDVAARPPVGKFT